MGLGLRVRDSGFIILGLGCQDYGFGSRVTGYALRVWDSAFRV